jgi:dimeric dUTPase (all-alpha-NTP-PPase superfamily)
MNLLPFYAKQLELDQAILEKHELEDNVQLVDDRVIAFKVELGELANEIRFFKFWTQKPQSPSPVILEEWVDCFHFLLSIGNFRKYSRFVKEMELYEPKGLEYNVLFHELFQNQLLSTSDFKYAMMFLFSIAKRLGFTEQDIQGMYEYKNQKNHKRQEENY